MIKRKSIAYYKAKSSAPSSTFTNREFRLAVEAKRKAKRDADRLTDEV